VSRPRPMRRPSRPLARALGASPLALALAAGVASAQGAPTGPQLSATLSQRFEADTNLELQPDSPGTSVFGETRLTLGVLGENPVQRFQLGFNTGLRALWRADEDFEFVAASPSTASLGWGRDWASGSVSADLRYRQRRVDFDRPLTGAFDPDTGVFFPDDPAEDLEGEAVERRYDGNVGLALATDRPSSYAFTLAASRLDFSEDAGNLTPRTTAEGNATWQLQLTPLFAGTLTARGFFYDAENATDTTTTESEITAGVVYDRSEVLRLTAGVGYFERERRDTIAGSRVVTENDSGASFRGGLRYAFEDVTVNASFRAATAPGTRISGNFNLAYPLPRGQVNARAFQTFSGGTGGDEIRVTGIGLGVRQDLDPFSRISFDIAGSRRVNVDDPLDEDVDRVDFTTTFGYDFTERISADIGYRFRWREEGATSADSHAVFVQIGRSFVTGF
jgi:hypothetical protein